MFKNGKPDIVLKTVKGFNIKKSFNSLYFRKKVRKIRNCCTRHV